MTTDEDAATARLEVVERTRGTAARLDEHHLPETNGRMEVCRRCGARTDGPDGGHAPHPQQLVRADEWLRKQVVSAKIERLKSQRDT